MTRCERSRGVDRSSIRKRTSNSRLAWEIQTEQTAFGDRSSDWMLSIDSTWHDPADDATNLDYTRAFWDAAASFSNGQTYFNFPGLFEEGDVFTLVPIGEGESSNHGQGARASWRNFEYSLPA